MEAEIISETKDYLVINKPAGLLVHGGIGIVGETLVDWLTKKYPDIKNVGEDPMRPGIVHRLDRDVSGLMVVCKNQETYDSLKAQFQDRTIKKEYTALVYGKLSKDEDEIDFPIKRATAGFKMAAVPKNFADHSDDKIRHAVTSISVIKKMVNYTLLKVNIKTGRTHQIRVHLFAYGHPIVGDNLYCTRITKLKNLKNKLDRVFLVSTELEFNDLEGVRQKFQAPLPDSIAKFLETAR
ncbi:MAG: RluA family pseudouridine synthase [Candidatus Falkowbacteria bacterium]